MQAEIIATGEELRTGALVDTNTSYIAQKLEEAGITVFRHSTVGDDLSTLASIFREIAGRSEIAVVTGGLGPTTDDLTTEAAARALGVDLMLNRQALKSIEDFFAARGRALNRSSQKQALLPQGAEAFLNAVGTAPGFMLKIKGCHFFFVPGVPHEMRKMLSESVLPRVQQLLGKERQFHGQQTLSVFGLTESVTGEMLSGFETNFPAIQLGLRAKFPEIQIKLYAKGLREIDLRPQLSAASRWVMDRLGSSVFADSERSMEAIVGDILRRKNENVAVAESCTGGLISHLLTNVPGSSNYFLFSAVSYTNQAKESVLGVSASTLKKFGAVHQQTVREMAEGVRRVCAATYGLSTSGIAGPDGGSQDKPVGTVCIGLATPHQSVAHRFRFSDFGRLRNKQIFAVTALDLLRCELLGIKSKNSIAITIA